jgi:hypothetical protein
MGEISGREGVVAIQLILRISGGKVCPTALRGVPGVRASEEKRMNPVEGPPRIVRWTLRLEEATALDRPGPVLEPSIEAWFGTGLLAAGPTAWSGWAEWSAAGSRDKRVGLVHAVTNGVAISVYAASWFARRRGRHGTGAGLALAAAAVSGVGAYLGGHLAQARKVASRHPAYDDAPLGV